MSNKRTTRQVRRGGNGTAALYVVIENGREIGLLEKYNDTRTEKHPWKSFQGVGMGCTFIGSFYEHEGGRQAALDSIEINPSTQNKLGYMQQKGAA